MKAVLALATIATTLPAQASWTLVVGATTVRLQAADGEPVRTNGPRATVDPIISSLADRCSRPCAPFFEYLQPFFRKR